MRNFIAIPLAAVAVLLTGCESEPLPSNAVVSEIPWAVPETTQYRVLDDEDQDVGTLEMTIEEARDGRVRLHQYFDFPEAGFVNDATVVAGAEDLAPVSTSFQIQGPEGDLMCGAAYLDGKVVVERVGEDGERTDELNVPRAAYDSWSDLFLWRTLPFAEGYDVEYTDVLSCTLARSQKQRVGLEVKGLEEVTVPAGTFDAWHLEIASGGGTQDAWYADNEARTLVKYDNDMQTFELTDDH